MATLNNNNKSLTQQQENKIATNNGYVGSNYQPGWGIGWGGDASQITKGFNSFNDSNAVRNELARVESVMGNRTTYGLDNDVYNSYYDKLKTAYEPFSTAEKKASDAQTAWQSKADQQTADYLSQFNNYNNQISQANQNYYNSKAYTGYQESLDQTIDGLASKYGFTFNRDVANQQAEAEAQALRDANADAQRKNVASNESNTNKINANLMNMAENLERSYFQQALNQSQNQVNSGLNAGIAADQDLRLQMARAAEMSAANRDANLGLIDEQNRFTNEELRLAEALGTINQQATARGNELVNNWEQQMFQNILSDRDSYMNAANMEWGQSQDLVNQYLNQQNALTGQYQYQNDFDYNALRDIIGDTQFDRTLAQQQMETAQEQENWLAQFARENNRNAVADNQWQQQFNWSKLMDEAGLTGMYNGSPTLAGQSSQLAQQSQNWSQYMDSANLAQRQYEFNNMSATEKAQFNQNASQFGEEMAWKLYEMESGNALQREMLQAELSAYNTGNSASTTLGSLASKYESSGNAGTVARTKGDIGGASYGKYQLTTASGGAQKFADNYGGALKGLKAGTAAFDAAWKAEAASNPEKFSAAQDAWIQQSHYQPAMSAFTKATGIKESQLPTAVKEVIMSVGIQHGAGGASTLFKNAGITSGMSASTIINKIYDERSKVDKYFKSSTSAIKKSVYNRFQNERQDALNMLK